MCAVRSANKLYGQLFEKRFLLITAVHSSDQNDSFAIENKSIQSKSTRAKHCFCFFFFSFAFRVAAVSMNSARAKITTLASQSQTRICDVCANFLWATEQAESGRRHPMCRSLPNSFCAFEINQVVRSKSHFVQSHDDSSPFIRRAIFNMYESYE